MPAAWVAAACTRYQRHLECAPADRIAMDKAAMIPLPPPGSPGGGALRGCRVITNIRLDGNDYSVDPSAAGRRICRRH